MTWQKRRRLKAAPPQVSVNVMEEAGLVGEDTWRWEHREKQEDGGDISRLRGEAYVCFILLKNNNYKTDSP